jgi:hypothetical protein
MVHQHGRLQAALASQLAIAHKRVVAKYQLHATLIVVTASRLHLKRKTTFVHAFEQLDSFAS